MPSVMRPLPSGGDPPSSRPGLPSSSTWPRVSGAGASIELLRALDGAASQSELLKELLPAISEHAARAVVLVLRDGKVTAWSGIGFTDGEALRSWQGNAVESPALTKLLEVYQAGSIRPHRR